MAKKEEGVSKDAQGAATPAADAVLSDVTTPPTGQTKDTPRSKKVTPVRKLSAKVLMPNIKAVGRQLTEEKPGPVFVGRILGLVRGHEVVSTDFGDSVRFKGEFRGFDGAGNEFIASAAFLPAAISEPLEQALMGRDELNANKAIEFACDLYIKYSDSAVGYEYVVEVHSEAKPSEPLTGLLASLPSLPAPKVA